MTIVRKISILFISIISLIVLGVLDYADRTIIYSKNTSEKELRVFALYKTVDEVKLAYGKHFQDSEYRFPRVDVKKSNDL